MSLNQLYFMLYGMSTWAHQNSTKTDASPVEKRGQNLAKSLVRLGSAHNGGGELESGPQKVYEFMAFLFARTMQKFLFIQLDAPRYASRISSSCMFHY